MLRRANHSQRQAGENPFCLLRARPCLAFFPSLAVARHSGQTRPSMSITGRLPCAAVQRLIAIANRQGGSSLIAWIFISNAKKCILMLDYLIYVQYIAYIDFLNVA